MNIAKKITPSVPTPGPWTCDGYPEGQVYEVSGGQDERLICCCEFELEDDDCAWPPMAESRANAHLIAAAPELYEACEAAFKFLGGVDGAATLRDQLLNALSKAEGKANSRREAGSAQEAPATNK